MKWWLLLLLLIPVYADIDEIRPEKINCYENGVVELVLSNGMEKLRIDSVVKGVGYQKTPGAEYTPIEGAWFGEDYKPIDESSQREKIRFISEEFSIVEKDNYTFTLSPKPIEITRFYPDATLIRFDTSCPGYVHSCKFVNITVDECYRQQDGLHIVYHGLGANDYSKVEQDRDISIYLNGKIGKKGGNLVGDDATSYTKVGNDTYEVVIDTDISHVMSVVMSISGCNKALYKTEDYSSCGVVIEHKENVTEESPENSENMTGREENMTGVHLEQPKKTHVGSLLDFLLSLIPY
ncbi:MAG: hypothetical protein ACLFP2_02240 [Candidatus Woesearchaeota archaeon]